VFINLKIVKCGMVISQKTWATVHIKHFVILSVAKSGSPYDINTYRYYRKNNLLSSTPSYFIKGLWLQVHWNNWSENLVYQPMPKKGKNIGIVFHQNSIDLCDIECF